MKKSLNKSITAILMVGLLFFESLSITEIQGINAYAYTEKSATVKATSLNVRSGPGTSYSKVTSLSHGVKVTITDETTASDGATWYSIRCNGNNGSQITGYVSKAYIKEATTYITDNSFEQQLSDQGFPESYKVYLREIHSEYPNWVFTAQKTGLDWGDAISNESVVGRNLVYNSSISSWKSIADGAYDWNSSTWPGFDSASWVAASQEIISYYMDPRNFLDTTYVFQFLDQEYDASAHNASGVETLVKGTFMEGSASAMPETPEETSEANTTEPVTSGTVTEIGPGVSGGTTTGSSENNTNETLPSGTGTSSNVSLQAPRASIVPKLKNIVADTATVSSYGPGIDLGGSGSTSDQSGTAPTSGTKSYVDIIMNAANQSGVNPYVLTAMIIQEQGTKGTSGLISGNNSSYPGIYNFFNIEAYQSGSTGAVSRGLWWASQSGSYGRPWNSVEAAIVGGAKYYGENYVKSGQDTFYLKKFNVNGANLYKHQYMTNIQGAAGEGAKLSQAYSEELKKTSLNFNIPIYNNMPDTVLPCPTVDGSPNNKLASLSVEGYTLTPTYSKDTESYDLIVEEDVNEIKVNASAIDKTASIGGLGTVKLSSGVNTVDITVTAQNGSIRTYRLNIFKQGSGTTSSLETGSSSGSGAGTSSGSGIAGYGPGYVGGTSESAGTAVLISPSGN